MNDASAVDDGTLESLIAQVARGGAPSRPSSTGVALERVERAFQTLLSEILDHPELRRELFRGHRNAETELSAEELRGRHVAPTVLRHSTTLKKLVRQATLRTERDVKAPIPVLAPSTPGDCFWVAVEACRIALKYMIPVIILSDGYLANGAEPWRIPSVNDIPGIQVKYATDPTGFLPYKRDPQTLARPWAIPGTPGLEHRIGGIEKQDITGNINYEPMNHEKMVRLRAAKVEGIAQDIPDVVPAGDPDGDLLIVAWGSTYGAITAGMKAGRANGHRIGHVHLRHLNPFPKNLGEVLGRYKHVLVPEMNMGQLSMILRAKFLVDAQGYNKIQGQPFKQSEIEGKIEEILG